MSKTYARQDKLFYIKWLWRRCAIWLFRNAGGDSVVSWLIEQLPLIQCCHDSRTSCLISTRKTGSGLHNHVAGTMPSNDSSVFLEIAKCKIRRTISRQVGRKAGFRCFCCQNFDWFRKQTLCEWPERKKADRPVGRAIDFHRSLGPLSASGVQDRTLAVLQKTVVPTRGIWPRLSINQSAFRASQSSVIAAISSELSSIIGMCEFPTMPCFGRSRVSTGQSKARSLFECAVASAL